MECIHRGLCPNECPCDYYEEGDVTVLKSSNGSMVKCKNCANLVNDWCDMKVDSPVPDMDRECHWFSRATHYDRLLEKSDEELADWIETIAPSGTYQFWLNGKTWLQWLREEVCG